MSSPIDTLVARVGAGLLRVAGAQVSEGIRKHLEAKQIEQLLREAAEVGAADLAKSAVDFLETKDAETLARQAFAVCVRGGIAAQVESVRDSFIKAYCLHESVSTSGAQRAARNLFESLWVAVNRTWAAALETGVLRAEAIRTSLNDSILQDEIAAIEDAYSAYSKLDSSGLARILKFERDFRRQVADRFRFVTPPSLDTNQKVPIEKLYVGAQFASEAIDGGSLISADALLTGAHRIVVLGNPGGGKSTFLGFLCRKLASSPRNALVGGRNLTPILITLRDYAGEKGHNPVSLLDFVESQARARYQLNVPEGALDVLVATGRVLLLLDGLDELLEPGLRAKIVEDIDAFCNQHPAVPVIVTSRQVGYELAPLDSGRFRVCRLAEFNDNQVQEYARKWFSLDRDLGRADRITLASAFFAESQLAPDLRRNPLLLGLLCSLFRGEGYIPRNRPAVYEKCATLLFERWDKARGIRVQLPFEHHIRPAIGFLAHWIYSECSLESGVTESRLVQRVSEYLQERRFDDESEALAAASDFVEFCRGRAWVLTEVGADPVSGDGLFHFVHRTFLEYFTAAHLVRIYPTAHQLTLEIQDRILRREWDVVAHLAVGLLDRQAEGAADEVIRVLLAAARRQSSESLIVSAFCARLLGSVVPTRATVRQVVEEVFAASAACLEEAQLSFEAVVGQAVSESIEGLRGGSEENRAVISSRFGELVDSSIEAGGAKSRSALALAIFATYRGQLEMSTARELFDPTTLSRHESAIRSIVAEHCEFSSFAVFCGVALLSEIVKWHGADILFRQCELPFGVIRWLPPAAMLTLSVDFQRRPFHASRSHDVQVEDGLECLLTLKFPLPRRDGLPSIRSFLGSGSDARDIGARDRYPSEVAFGAALLGGAIFFELHDEAGESRDAEVAMPTGSFGHLLKARHLGRQTEEADAVLDQLSGMPRLRDCLRGWIERAVDFWTAAQ